jgi:uncharacterized protein Usg
MKNVNRLHGLNADVCPVTYGIGNIAVDCLDTSNITFHVPTHFLFILTYYKAIYAISPLHLVAKGFVSFVKTTHWLTIPISLPSHRRIRTKYKYFSKEKS